MSGGAPRLSASKRPAGPVFHVEHRSVARATRCSWPPPATGHPFHVKRRRQPTARPRPAGLAAGRGRRRQAVRLRDRPIDGHACGGPAGHPSPVRLAGDGCSGERPGSAVRRAAARPWWASPVRCCCSSASVSAVVGSRRRAGRRTVPTLCRAGGPAPANARRGGAAEQPVRSTRTGPPEPPGRVGRPVLRRAPRPTTGRHRAGAVRARRPRARRPPRSPLSASNDPPAGQQRQAPAGQPVQRRDRAGRHHVAPSSSPCRLLGAGRGRTSTVVERRARRRPRCRKSARRSSGSTRRTRRSGPHDGERDAGQPGAGPDVDHQPGVREGGRRHRRS